MQVMKPMSSSWRRSSVVAGAMIGDGDWAAVVMQHLEGIGERAEPSGPREPTSYPAERGTGRLDPVPMWTGVVRRVRSKRLMLSRRAHMLSGPKAPSAASTMTTFDIPIAPAASELPVHLTHFIGRERELTELTRLVQSVRLLTLTGAGGSGKTR